MTPARADSCAARDRVRRAPPRLEDLSDARTGRPPLVLPLTSGWMLFLGLWLAALAPQIPLLGAHTIFIGGFGVLTAGIATRVVVRHGSYPLAVEDVVLLPGMTLLLARRSSPACSRASRRAHGDARGERTGVDWRGFFCHRGGAAHPPARPRRAVPRPPRPLLPRPLF